MSASSYVRFRSDPINGEMQALSSGTFWMRLKRRCQYTYAHINDTQRYRRAVMTILDEV